MESSRMEIKIERLERDDLNQIVSDFQLFAKKTVEDYNYLCQVFFNVGSINLICCRKLLLRVKMPVLTAPHHWMRPLLMKSSTRSMVHFLLTKLIVGEFAYLDNIKLWRSDKARADLPLRSKSRRSMNMREFMNVLHEASLIPKALDKRTASKVFKYVNNDAAVSDFDSKELSLYEFASAIEMIIMKAGGLSFNGIGTISDVAFDWTFKEVSLFNSKMETSINMEQFVKIFASVLRLPLKELELLFNKIDVNCDEAITWDEFADFVLDMQIKECTPAKGDAVFDGSLEEDLDLAYHHPDEIIGLVYIRQLSMFGSVSKAGVLQVRSSNFNQSTLSSKHSRQTDSICAGNTILCMTV
eukprot:766963-Hanusia_phi.AAC.3